MLTAQGLEHLSARESDTGLVRVVVDTSKGSRNKYKYDETLGLYRLSKVLPLGITFPYDFGSIPSTRAEDGDPLDVLVLGEEALLPGFLVTVRLAACRRENAMAKCKALSLVRSRPHTQTNHLSVSESVLVREAFLPVWYLSTIAYALLRPS